MLGPGLVRPLTVAVAALAVVTAATGTTAVIVAMRADEDPIGAGDGLSSSDTTEAAAGSVPSTAGAPTATGAAAPATSTPAPTATSSTPASTRQCAQLRDLSTRAKLAQLLFVGISDAGTARSVLSGPNPAGGVLVLGKGSTWFGNGVLKGIAAGASVPPVVAADEEGGRVQRIDGIHGSMVSAYQMGRMPPAQVQAIAKKRGGQLRDLGFTMDFAPVIDLYDRDNAVINDRAFDADPQKVVTYGGAFAAGLRESGITPVLKHFPGHGRSTGDSHKQSVETPPLAELRKADLKPFQAMVPGAPAVMVGHLDVPGLTDPGRPTSVSRRAIDDLLRTELGFRGLVITDDLSGMKAITDRFTVPEAVIASIAAGADVAIIALGAGQTLGPMLGALEAAVKAGKLSMARVDEALGRLGAVKPGCR